MTFTGTSRPPEFPARYSMQNERSALDFSTEVLLAQQGLKRCKLCSTRRFPVVLKGGYCSEWLHFFMFWKCDCGTVADEEIGFDWGHIEGLQWHGEDFAQDLTD